MSDTDPDVTRALALVEKLVPILEAVDAETVMNVLALLIVGGAREMEISMEVVLNNIREMADEWENIPTEFTIFNPSNRVH